MARCGALVQTFCKGCFRFEWYALLGMQMGSRGDRASELQRPVSKCDSLLLPLQLIPSQSHSRQLPTRLHVAITAFDVEV